MSDRLDDALRAHYRRQRPAPETLARLAALAETAPTRRRRRWPLAAAATSALAALAGLALLTLPADPLAERVAAEIALNHEKLVEPDVRGASLAALAAGLDRLDFAPAEPPRVAAAGLRFTGARYCSLQGQLAVQLQLVDEAGRRVTLYQTRATPRFAGLGEGRLRAGATEVELWSQGGVVLGLAHSAP